MSARTPPLHADGGGHARGPVLLYLTGTDMCRSIMRVGGAFARCISHLAHMKPHVTTGIELKKALSILNLGGFSKHHIAVIEWRVGVASQLHLHWMCVHSSIDEGQRTAPSAEAVNGAQRAVGVRAAGDAVQSHGP